MVKTENPAGHDEDTSLCRFCGSKIQLRGPEWEDYSDFLAGICPSNNSLRHVPE